MELTDKKILVTGGSGLIGSHLVSRLLEIGFSRLRVTYHRHPPVISDPRIEYVQADLTKGEDCRKVVDGIDVAFHIAAYSTGAADVAKNPLVHVTPNVLINTQMIQAAYDAGVKKYLWLSSSTVYPPSGARPVREDDPLDRDPYEKSYFYGHVKRFSEVLCRMYGEKLAKPMTTIVLRPANVYGPYDDFEPATSHVIPALIRKSVERQDPFEVWGTGEEVRDVIYVSDMVEAMIRAMERIESFDILNVATGIGVSIKKILETILELDGYQDAKIFYNPAKPTTFPIRIIDISKAEHILGFKPAVDLREGLKRTIDWYREVRGLPKRPQ